MLRTHEDKYVYSEKEKSGFVTTFDLIKCLNKIKQHHVEEFAFGQESISLYRVYRVIHHAAILEIRPSSNGCIPCSAGRFNGCRLEQQSAPFPPTEQRFAGCILKVYPNFCFVSGLLHNLILYNIQPPPPYIILYFNSVFNTLI